MCMANVLLIDDERLSLERLYDVLHGQHDIVVAENGPFGIRTFEAIGNALDILVIEGSLWTTELFERLAKSCSQAKVLILTHNYRYAADQHVWLRKPFTDQYLLDTVNEMLSERLAVLELPKTQTVHRAKPRVDRARAAGR